ncbi:hypothetical protein AB1Y20_004901 [Prymnesium parvum]|uniref:Pumilio domain-containing protein NOP9 n=1 Tax=Prymnesium parvum TaxID=97485 RepID=A0AB34J045_PRYPA
MERHAAPPPKLAADLLSFLRRASKLLDDASPPAAPPSSASPPPPDDDGLAAHRRELADSILTQARGAELACARHVFGSHAVQSALRHASPPLAAAFSLALLSSPPLPLLADKYASHVAEAALPHAAASLAASLLSRDGAPLLEAMRDRTATHVVRSLFASLAAASEAELLCRLADAVARADVHAAATHAASSAALQALLLSAPPHAAKRLAAAALRWDGAAPPSQAQAEHVRSLAREPSGSHVLELLLRAPQMGWWRPVHSHCLRGELPALAAHESASHVVQALIDTAADARAFGFVLKELLPEVPTLLRTRTAVVCRLAQACSRVGGGGRDLMRAVRQAVPSADKGDAFARALLRLGPTRDERWGTQAEAEAAADSAAVGLTPVGSRLVQALLALPSGIGDPVLQSLASLHAGSLFDLSTSPLGSRVLEAALKAEGMHAPRAKLRKWATQSAAKLARDKLGSFVLEAAFASGSTEDKSKILEALAPVEADLRCTPHGVLLLKKVRFTHWKQHPESWKLREQKAQTTYQAFEELIRNDESSTAPAEKPRSAKRAPHPPPGEGRRQARAAQTLQGDVGRERQELNALFDGAAARPAPRAPREAKPPRRRGGEGEAPPPKKRKRAEKDKAAGGSSAWLAAALSGKSAAGPAVAKRKFSMT